MSDEEQKSSSLDAWVARIRDQEMPIFGLTAERIRALTDSEKSAVMELAEAILHDPGMTTKLLRIANSVIFNPSGWQITTVSRAIIMLGFNMVRQIALTVAFVDALLQGPLRTRVLHEMARAFHAGVQARWLAIKRHDAQAEEVFIAALLYRFGELAFWCCAGEMGDRLDRALSERPKDPGAVEEKLLGFRLRQLTPALIGDWHLSPLLQQVLRGGLARGSREEAVVIAYRLAEATETGWQTTKAKACIREVAAYLNVAPQDIEVQLTVNAADAAHIAKEFGAVAVLPYLPETPTA